MNATALIEALDALLPQTQCRRCGHDGCRPYAEALVTHGVSVALCPPGGESTREHLAALLARNDGSSPLPLEAPRLAWVREVDCIGCTQCLDACPVDAIVGAAGRMHTVLSASCTGCGLCVPVCPTDCIEMPLSAAPEPSPSDNRARYERRRARLTADIVTHQAPALVALETDSETLHATVLAAVQRRRDRASGRL